MSATTTTTTAGRLDPLTRPRLVVGKLDASVAGPLQQAASDGRLDIAGEYSTETPTERASFINITSGVLGFVTTILAVPLALVTYLSRAHAGNVQISGGAVFALIIVNIAAGFGAVVAHEALHALACRLLGGAPALTQTTPLTIAWSAPTAAFARRSYLAVTLAPFVVVLVAWLVILVAVPAASAFVLAALIVNMAASGADLWIARAVTRQPPGAVLFADTNTGFVAYAVTATRPARKKTPTTPIAKSNPPRR